MSVSELFDDGLHDSPLVLEATQALRQLDDDDVKLVLGLIRRILQQSER